LGLLLACNNSIYPPGKLFLCLAGQRQRHEIEVVMVGVHGGVSRDRQVVNGQRAARHDPETFSLVLLCDLLALGARRARRGLLLWCRCVPVWLDFPARMGLASPSRRPRLPTVPLKKATTKAPRRRRNGRLPLYPDTRTHFAPAAHNWRLPSRSVRSTADPLLRASLASPAGR
jgi:hypothetical protein